MVPVRIEMDYNMSEIIFLNSSLPGLHPMLASALQFALDKATAEGKITICALLVFSFLSWTVIFSKARQLASVAKMTRQFFNAYAQTQEPLALLRSGQAFIGSPAYAVYKVGAEAAKYHLEKSPLINGQRRLDPTRLDAIRVAIERATGDQVILLERGMIVLSTAVAGGPFLGLLGTVWGVMETFAGIARASSASLAAMAPGVAGALIATVAGLMVAIPAMFAYNFMVTRVRSVTQQLDAYAAEFASAIELEHGTLATAQVESVDTNHTSLGHGTKPDAAKIARSGIPVAAVS